MSPGIGIQGVGSAQVPDQDMAGRVVRVLSNSQAQRGSCEASPAVVVLVPAILRIGIDVTELVVGGRRPCCDELRLGHQDRKLVSAGGDELLVTVEAPGLRLETAKLDE